MIATVSGLLARAPIAYLKWDCNRGMHEIGSAAGPHRHAGEVAHRYMLGLYRVLEALHTQFPEVLIEGCASGGGRFDGGMLYHTPQIWTSDNTDALDRLRIQWGTSFAYPASSMGAHVSAVPNHQVQRSTPLRFRAHVAMMAGSFGYEMELRALSPQERTETQAHLSLYRDIQPVVHHGDLFRLRSPFEGNWPALAYISKDYLRCVLFAFCIDGRSGGFAPPRLKLQGLDPEGGYANKQTGERMLGDELMRHGLSLPLRGEYDCVIVQLHRAV